MGAAAVSTLSPGRLWLCALMLLGSTVRAETEAPGSAASTAGEPGAVTAVQAEPVIIESELLEPTQEQLAQRFRQQLGEPPSYVVSERQLASGMLEVTTRYARFCVRPTGPAGQSGVGGNVTIAAPCFLY